MAETSWEAPAAEPAREDGRGIDLTSHLRILRKRIWLIVILTIVTGSLGAVWVARQPKIYRSKASVVIDTTTPRVLGDIREVVDIGAADYWSNKEFFETQYRVITSIEVLERAAIALALDRDLEFLGLVGLPDDEKAAALTRAKPAKRLQGMVRVEPVKSSQIADIVVEDTDPERAAKIADAVVEAYIQSNVGRRHSGSEDATKWLGEQMTDLTTKLESSELALYQFKRDQDVLSASMEDRQNIVSQRLVELNGALTVAMAERAKVGAALSELERIRKENSGDRLWPLRIGRIAEDPVIQKLREAVATQESEVAAIAERYLEKHPERMASEQRLASNRKQLEAELERAVARVRSQERELSALERDLSSLIGAVKTEAFALNKKEIDYKKLAREQQNNQRLYEVVLGRLKDADLTSALRANNVRPLDRAEIVRSPIRPRVTMTILVALLAGLLLGVGLTYALEFLDNTVKTEDDVEFGMGVPFLGMIPSVDQEALAKVPATGLNADRSRDLHVHLAPKSAAAEAIRSIRTNLLFMSPDRELKRLLITSSGPQEGKTTTCIAIGTTMAQNAQRVLIIDTDMRRPRLHRSFGVSNDVGLSTVLVGESTLENAIKSTDVPNLFLLPCGPVPPNPAEMLHTQRFQETLAELSKRYDRVVLDSPPLAAVADAAVLSSAVDGVLVVARFRGTPKELLRKSLRSLRDVKAPLLGVVVNAVDLKSREYDYYYYRRYGYYYGDDANAPAKS